MNRPILLICSCINVFAPSKLFEPNIRKSQYLNSLVYFLTKSQISRIIVVENTNSNWVSEEVLNLAKLNNKIIEVILFQADIQMARKHTIGYSHFEMVFEAIQKSKIFQKSDSLVVMDGRHIIKNINYIYNKLENGKCAFIPEITRFQRNNLCDIRLYMITSEIFLKYIWPRRFELSMKRDEWAEALLDNILKSKKFKFNKLPTLPRIIGTQGSTGVSWDGNNFFKYHLKLFVIWIFNLLKY